MHNTIRIQAALFIIPLILSAACQFSQPGKSLSEEDKIELISQGKVITQESFKALSGELSKALTEGGVVHAAGYCHLKASPVIDSLSARFNVKISRTSLKYRNPANKPGQLDMTVMDAYRTQLAEGNILQPHLEITAEEIVFYAPIVIQNPMCLICHGEPGKTMEAETYEFIKSKYPEDMATGYQIGDLRGAWKIVYPL